MKYDTINPKSYGTKKGKIKQKKKQNKREYNM